MFETLSKNADFKKIRPEGKIGYIKSALQNSRDYNSLIGNYWKIIQEKAEICCPVDSENDVLSLGLAVESRYNPYMMDQIRQNNLPLYDSVTRANDYISKNKIGEKISEDVHSFIEPVLPVIKQRFGLKC